MLHLERIVRMRPRNSNRGSRRMSWHRGCTRRRRRSHSIGAAFKPATNGGLGRLFGNTEAGRKSGHILRQQFGAARSSRCCRFAANHELGDVGKLGRLCLIVADSAPLKYTQGLLLRQRRHCF